jgi:NTP pyrophosphatase (non-canonical NTP hydrolase)
MKKSEKMKPELSLRIYDGLDFLVGTAHENSCAAGWWNDLATGEPIPLTQECVGDKLMLIVTEIAEAKEGFRKGLMDDHLPNRKMVEVELADAIIRIADLCGALGLDLGGAVVEKMEYNKSRPDHKPENRRKPGGKKT